MKILIAGAQGQLGRELIEQNRLTGYAIVAPSHAHMDITDCDKVKYFMHFHRPTLVINAAAYTHVDNAEIDRSLAFSVNKTGCANLASVCAENGLPLIQISTDYVFDGTKNTPYKETDPISPLGVYGRSKADGEAQIRMLLKEHIILRTSWLYGVYGQNFVKTMLKLAGTQKKIRVVADQYGSPTNAADLAQAIMSIADLLNRHASDDWGTYHYCGRGITTWHAFAETIMKLARRHGSIKAAQVEAVNTANYPTQAKRPPFSALNCSRIVKKFKIDLKPWQKSLEITVQKLLSGKTRNF
ncbi:MAG: dTDP-4-dehydrorhamnose reductase [Desulfobacterales bacterium]|nr:dTDP-4-dehydrorhamnose reductase [Deltaproteobacteria bacterium]NNL76572.1 dTDP-4-dehydrorhamnose reductase [Desulfobacterales bacterium]